MAPKAGRINSRIDEQLEDELTKIEKTTKLSRSDIVRSALAVGLPLVRRDSILAPKRKVRAAFRRRQASNPA